MSRHILIARAPNHEVVVGWERAISRAHLVLEAVAPYAVVPDELQAVLEAEQAINLIDPEAMCNTIRDWREDR